MIRNIRLLYDQYGARHFNILDDNFTFNRDYVMQFCQEYIKNPLKDATFCCPNGIRADKIDEEMVIMLKKCGFSKLMIGVESGSSFILEAMKKHLDLAKVHECCKLLRKHKIQSWGFFILGYPGETAKTIKETLDLALNLPLDWASFSLFSPIPGTEIYNYRVVS